MTPKMTRAAFLRGRLPGLKKLAASGPGGGPFLGGCWLLWGLPGGWPGLLGWLAKGGVTEVA